MTEEHGSNPEKGLSVGTIAPLIDTNDVFENIIRSKDLFQEYRGIVLDFSRGAW